MQKRFKNIKDGFENEQKLGEKYFVHTSTSIQIQRKPIVQNNNNYNNSETLEVHEHEHLRWLHLFRKNEATAVYTEPGLLYT
jgi:hypothetical protein